MITPGIVKSGMLKTARGRLALSKGGYVVEVDRGLAIEAAINAAAPGDTVLIAGKGHEDYQILGTTKIHFDDREKVKEALENLRRGESHA
jgi:UDP-N-acetylmuramoyl-L-alanyl-D-glutamate--2,6-diaminopimelate ligase